MLSIRGTGNRRIIGIIDDENAFFHTVSLKVCLLFICIVSKATLMNTRMAQTALFEIPLNFSSSIIDTTHRQLDRQADLLDPRHLT